MTAGVVSGLQNRFGVRKASRVGSIPTRSRAAVRAMAAPVALACVLGSYAFIPRALSAQETDPPAQAATDSLAADPIALDELGAGAQLEIALDEHQASLDVIEVALDQLP